MDLYKHEYMHEVYFSSSKHMVHGQTLFQKCFNHDFWIDSNNTSLSMGNKSLGDSRVINILGFQAKILV